MWGILKNSAYVGQARFGKTRVGPRRPRLRGQRGKPEESRKDASTYDTPIEEQIVIPVPAIVEEPFAAVAEQLTENRGAVVSVNAAVATYFKVCSYAKCRYAYYGKPLSLSSPRVNHVNTPTIVAWELTHIASAGNVFATIGSAEPI